MRLAMASSRLRGANLCLPPSPVQTRRAARAPRRPGAAPARHLAPLTASKSATSSAAPAAARPSSGWRAFWSTVDTGAWLGTVGTGIALLLTQEALLLGGPILLPLVALYASRQRTRLDAQAAQAELQRQVAAALRQFSAVSEEAAVEIADEVAAAVEEVWQGRPATDEALRALETKFAALESTVRGVGEAAAGVREEAAAAQGRTVREVSAVLGVLRRDLAADLQQASGDELAALGRLDARLAVS